MLGIASTVPTSESGHCAPSRLQFATKLSVFSTWIKKQIEIAGKGGYGPGCEDVSKSMCETDYNVWLSCEETCKHFNLTKINDKICQDQATSSWCSKVGHKCLQDFEVIKKCKRTCGMCEPCQDMTKRCPDFVTNLASCAKVWVRKLCKKTCKRCTCIDIWPSKVCHSAKSQCALNSVIQDRCQKTCDCQ